MTDPTGTVQTQEVTYENINTDAPNELDRPFTVRHEELSCNFYWTSKAGYSLQTTIRGNPTTAEIHAHLEAVVETVRAVIKLGGSPKGGQAQASPAPMPTNGSAAPPPLPAAPAAKPQAGPLVIFAAKLEVTPKDGKAEVKFYDSDPSHKFPVLSGTKTAEAWAMLLSGCGGWTVGHFAEAKTFLLAPQYKVTYHLSEKLNSKGNPYKDIDRIDLA